MAKATTKTTKETTLSLPGKLQTVHVTRPKNVVTIVNDVDDIDVRDTFALNWAISFRIQPAHDVYVERDTLAVNLDPSQAPPGVPSTDRALLIGSKLGIDATRKFAYPATALPPAPASSPRERRRGAARRRRRRPVSSWKLPAVSVDDTRLAGLRAPFSDHDGETS